MVFIVGLMSLVCALSGFFAGYVLGYEARTKDEQTV